MRPPRAVIVEDEPVLRQEIKTVLGSLWPELQIVAEVGDGIEAIDVLERLAPDVLFLDIHLPGASGIDVARHASEKAHVVFITAFDSFALQAFQQGALDYIIKPIDIDRMKLTVSRLQRRLMDVPGDLRGLADLLKSTLHGGVRYLKWLTMPKGNELHVVAVDDILYVRADNKYTTVWTRASSFLCNSSLKEMKERLDPAVFWQIHRSVIVNVGAIDTICRSMRGTLEVKVKGGNELLPVSEAYAHLFKPR